MPKVSVIMPIYNAEKYLERSIESIQNQTLQDIQIILVNDGSTDNSLYICKKYSERDDRIKIIDKSNGGVSSARNIGIENSKGEYIAFVDADDWIEPEMYEKMYYKIKQMQADMCMCNYVLDRNGKTDLISLNVSQDLLEKQQIIDDIIANMISAPTLNSKAQSIMGSVWRLIIKKDFIDKYNLRFPVGIAFMEDLIFCIEALMRSDKVCIDRGFYYHYCRNPQSAVSSYRENMMEEQQQVFQIIKNILIQEKLDQALEQRLNIRYVNMCITLIANEVHKDNSKKENEKIRNVYAICNDEKLKKSLKTIDTRGYTLRKKTVLTAMKHEWGLYLYLYYNIITRILNR